MKIHQSGLGRVIVSILLVRCNPSVVALHGLTQLVGQGMLEFSFFFCFCNHIFQIHSNPSFFPTHLTATITVAVEGFFSEELIQWQGKGAMPRDPHQ
jgi:hypothetical protein